MKTYRKIISIVLSLALVMSLCIVQAPTKSFAGVKIIVGKKLDIDIGSKDTIVVKGKAKAKSSSKKIAKITKTKKSKKQTKITVKGMKVGKTKIKVKVKKKSKKVSVVVRPKTPSSLKAALASQTSARLTWSKAKGANGYYVYRSASRNGTYSKIATVKTNTYTNTGLALGKYFYYKVIAYGNKNIQSYEYSNIVSVKTWKLVWQDEFEGAALDTTKWNNEGATGDGGFGNKELQDYQMEYSEVKDGKFIIKPTIYWDKANNTLVKNGSHWEAYSTKVWTKDTDTDKSFAQFTYGKFEFRAKMPKGKGTWAAGWMLGTGAGGGWPTCGEIDVFETTNQEAKTWIPQSLHMKKFNGDKSSSGNKHYDTTVSDATTAYHTYGVEWYPTYIKFTIDGKQTGIYDPSIFTTENPATDDMSVWPYKFPFYLIMNCAIGGTLGGEVTPKYWTLKDEFGDTQVYEDYLYFDYVRVYQ
ncbi:MAG: family 16 glycosylhydrolase [Eubacterium sp.]|nr:family 16 glycosylhydrolase [Eubacterium sp.]